MKHAAWMGLAMAFLASGTGAMADEAARDLRCYIVSLQMMNTADANVQMAAIMAHGYWLGRLDSLIPKDKLEDRVTAEYLEMSKPEIFKTEANRCGQAMIARGKAEADMGKAITARTQKMIKDGGAR